MNLPNFSFEKKLWSRGLTTIAGADEVGRGAFAGPVVAGCVVFSNTLTIKQFNNNIVINDSKKLTPRARQEASIWIKQNSLAWGIGECSVSKINSIGMSKATHIAFRKALSVVRSRLAIDFLLVDAFYVPFTRSLPKTNQLPIIKGDSLSISIAAASILAKVYRDLLMQKLAKKYPHYHWHQNKGYGTLAHRQALQIHGPCVHHRTQFIQRLVT